MKSYSKERRTISQHISRIIVFAFVFAASLHPQQISSAARPGARSVMDAHNCYPYAEWWHNRIDRALSAGTPLAIEQDLGWYTDPKTGRSWSVVTHGDPITGHEPTLEHYFFDRVRSIVEHALDVADHTANKDYHAAPDVIDSEKATNYRRWWNNPWRVVEPGGQQHAGDWTPEKASRLRALVEHAHANGLWIRFYTLDGAAEDELSCHGWFHSYNFGNIAAARARWQAAIVAGVDYIASDQYELLANEVHQITRVHDARSQ